MKIFILSLTLFFNLFANDDLKDFYHLLNEDKNLRYIKLGATVPPGEHLLPTIGLGIRHQMKNTGWDASANFASVLLINYASLKGAFLYYPYSEKKNQLYLGLGPGVGFYSCAKGNQFCTMTLEGTFGYEWRHSPHFKTFLQLECSQPIFRFSGRSNYVPGIALSGGCGF